MMDRKKKADKRLKHLVTPDEVYRTPSEFKNKIDKYFENCIIHDKIPTIYGLNRYIGYTSRLLDRRPEYKKVYKEATDEIKGEGKRSMIVRLYPNPDEFSRQVKKYFEKCELENTDYRYTGLLIFLKVSKYTADKLLSIRDPDDFIFDYQNILQAAILICEDDLIHKAQKGKTHHGIAIQELRQKVYGWQDKQTLEHSIDEDSFSNFFKEIQQTKQHLLEGEIVDAEIIE